MPPGLQKQPNAIGQNLEARVVELPTIAASLPSLNQAYQVALGDTLPDKGDPGATFVSTNHDPSAKLHEHATQILTEKDPVQEDYQIPVAEVATKTYKRLREIATKGADFQTMKEEINGVVASIPKTDYRNYTATFLNHF